MSKGCDDVTFSVLSPGDLVSLDIRRIDPATAIVEWDTD